MSDLRREMTRVVDAGIDAFSLDVMDGRFVPRTTFGARLAADARSWVAVPLEVHLMVSEPERWIDPMIAAGADLVMFHLEATSDAFAMIETIRGHGRLAGMAIEMTTPVDAITDEMIRALDVVNLLAVPAGFGGNASAADTHERIRELRARVDALGADMAIEVDGGVKPDNASGYAEAGADMLTSGTGIYKADDVGDAVRTLRSTTRERDDAARARLARFLAVPGREASLDERLEPMRRGEGVPADVWDPAGG